MPKNSVIDFLLARLQERSTYAGLGALLAVVGVHFSPEAMNGFVTAAISIAGFAAVLYKEK